MFYMSQVTLAYGDWWMHEPRSRFLSFLPLPLAGFGLCAGPSYLWLRFHPCVWFGAFLALCPPMFVFNWFSNHLLSESLSVVVFFYLSYGHGICLLLHFWSFLSFICIHHLLLIETMLFAFSDHDPYNMWQSLSVPDRIGESTLSELIDRDQALLSCSSLPAISTHVGVCLWVWV